MADTSMNFVADNCIAIALCGRRFDSVAHTETFEFVRLSREVNVSKRTALEADRVHRTNRIPSYDRTLDRET
jgi:hypothetical protein